MSSSAPSPPSSNNDDDHNHNHHHQNKNEALDKQHLIIALGVGLSIVALIAMCLLKLLWSASFSIFLNNRNQRRRSDRKPRKTPSERRLRKLDAESPTCTLEEWWSKSKVPPGPSEAEGDGQFICAICLEPVLCSQEIRDLKCLHVFHKECLDKWYLQDQFHCPLCHRAYYQQHIQPTNEFVWMV